VRNPRIRLALATGLVATWLGLLLCGVALGGGVHLLALAAVVVLPWRQMTG
jgi:hypothetical protein